MANNYLDQLKLPNNSIYYLRDNEAIGSLTRTGSSLIVANRVGTQTVIPNTDFDTINVTELNAGNLIVTGAARFLNPINGSITGQAGSVANSLVIQLNGGTTEGTNKFTYNGSASKTVNITKSSIGLGNVENKSSATIRGEITSSNVTTALGYTPLNKAGDTMTGPLKFGDQAIPQFSGSPSYILGIEAFASGGDVKWQNVSSIKVGSATKDGNGNVIADYYVKKSGDTMSGLLTTQAGITTNASLVLQKPDDVEWSLNGNNGEPAVEMNGAGDNAFKFKFTQYGTNVDVGWDWAAVAGSGAFFRQADSPSSPGYFGFFARNSSGTSQLMGSPSGVLTWANRRVVTSTNNTAVGTATQPVYVDANGYIVAGTALQGGAYKAVSTTVTQNDANLITSGAVYTAIANLPEPMVFKGTLGTGGTITTLPTASASNEGYTYKVITAGTYASQSAKVGDLFVCAETSSGVYSWVIIPAGDTDSDTWRNIKVDGTEKLSTAISSGLIDFTSGNHIALSFNATGNKLTIAHADTSSQASVSNSGRTYIQSITLDEDGHVTKLTSATETVTDTNYYHKTGTWSGLTYTAAKVGSPDDLAFTIPTGTTATTVALGNHNHDGVYLKLSGGTMTGVLALKGAQYEDSYSGALNANNSNIYNLNSIYTADAADAASEGIHFYRDATHVDSLWVAGGDIMFVPNRALGTSTTAANSQKVGRFTVNPTSGQVIITDGTTGGMKSSGYTIATSVPANAKFTDTTYTIGVSGNNVTLTPSSGTAQSITVPYATKSGLLQDDITEGTFRYIQSTDGSTTWTADNLGTTNSLAYIQAAISGAPSSNHGAIFSVSSVGTKFQLYFPDANYYVYKRYRNNTEGTWNPWFKIYSGYADSAGSVAWTGVTGKPTEYTPASGSGYYLTREPWWNQSDTTKDPDTLMSGVTFAYKGKHGNVPTVGTLVAFSARPNNDQYPLQFQSAYNSYNLYFRHRNGDTGTWNDWKEIIHSGNIGNQSVSYASSATSATKATQDESGNNIKATYMSSVSVASNVATFKNKNGTSLGTITASTDSYGSASAGTAISADDITSWSAGTLPTLGTAISADDITAWDAGSTPTLGTAISADDITAWSAGTMFSASFDGKCTLSLTSGSVPTLSYTGRSIPNVTSVGSVPSLSYTARSIPNVTGVGTLPDLKYTARSIPNISVSSKTVVTGIS